MNLIVFVMFISLLFDLLYQKGYQMQYFGGQMKNCCPIRHIWPEIGEAFDFFQNTDPIIFVRFIFLFF